MGAEGETFAGKITGFKELKGGIYFVAEIPRSISGKVQRRQLRAYWDRYRLVLG